MSDRRRGLTTMVRIGWRTQRRSVLVWVLALVASLGGTAASIAAIYDTPAKIHSYAEAVTSGSALLAINGRVEGIDSLGGVIQDEFGFLAAFLLPLLGIGLVARCTRREEESGRLELLLGGRVARHEPTLAALVLATLSILATGILFAVALISAGVPLGGSLLYAASLGALAFVFAAIAALLAQLALHSRGVYALSLVVLVAAYGLRGVGDVTSTWLTWLSPLGWAEKVAPFGPQRWWALGIPLAVGLTTAAVAVRLAGRRDLGSGLVRGGAGPERATALLRRPIGLALWIHRPAIVGWLVGAALLAGFTGALSQQLLDAMAGNPALADAMGGTGGTPMQGVVAPTQLYLAIVAAGYLVQAVSTMRTEEAEGRLEPRLAGTISRTRWLAAHGLVVLGGLVLIVVGSSVVLALTTALSVGSVDDLGSIMGAGVAYLPAEIVIAGLAVALFGVRPRAFGLAWVGYAVAAFVALLGPGLKLHRWVLDLAPTTHVGTPPLGTVDSWGVVTLVIVAVALVGIGFVGFRRRGIPQT